MKNIKLLTSIFIIFISLNIFSQSANLPKNAKKGDTFCYNKETNEWTKISPELYKLKKQGKLEALQYRLKELNYDIDITNCIDHKTVKAFEAEKYRLRKQKKNKRKMDRLKKKNIKNKGVRKQTE